MQSDDETIRAIYAADRADGSAILGTTMNLMAVIATYGGLVVAALGTDFFEQEERGAWLQAVIGAPLWGLVSYHYVLLCLVLARTNSILILERKMLTPNKILQPHEKNQIGSDAGDWISNLKTQPFPLRPGAFMAFATVTAAVIAVNVTTIWLLYDRNRPAFWTSFSVHLILFLCFACVVGTYLVGWDWMKKRMASRGAYAY